MRKHACTCTHTGISRAQISECLARLVRSLAEVTVMAERRRVLVDAVSRVEHIRAESDWLREFEADENRYKVGAGGGCARSRLTEPAAGQDCRGCAPDGHSKLDKSLPRTAQVK